MLFLKVFKQYIVYQTLTIYKQDPLHVIRAIAYIIM